MFVWLARPFGLAAVMFLTGCVGLIPVPSRSKSPEAGVVISRRQAGFIVAGKTTREEIRERLGPRVIECPRASALAYSWELPGGNGLWWIAGMYGGVAGEFEWTHWRALFVGFDQNDRVAVTEFVRLSGGRSLDEHLERWAARHKLGPRSPRITTGPTLASPSTAATDTPALAESGQSYPGRQ